MYKEDTRMTGRDYKKLMKLHRESKFSNVETNNENLKKLSKIVDNVLVKYQPVNYELFKGFIKERKQAANNSLVKVKNIEDTSKSKKESLFIKQHAVVWLKEWSRLANQVKTIELDLEDFSKLFKHNSVDYVNLNENDAETDIINDQDDFNDLFTDLNKIDELETFTLNLKNEFIKFKVRTIYPINDLKEDLQYYLSRNLRQNILKNNEQNSQILQTVNQVKQQQQKVLNKLEEDYDILNDDLNEILKEINENEIYVSEGIPPNAYNLESPDEELKISVLNEFLIIDFKYKEKLRQLNEIHKSLNEGPNKYGGWSQYENEIFQHIYDQYHNHNINLANCNFTLRDLMFDRMKRTFSLLRNIKIERTELVKHEEWCDANKYFQQQQKLIVTEWTESKKALLIKAEAIFAEAFEMIEKERIKNEEKEKQLRICNELYEKVTRWRNQKLEALEIQQKIDNMIKKQNADRIRLEKERENKRRLLEKQAIADFNNRLEAHKKQLETEEQARLEKLKRALNEQAKKDRERIEFRNKLLIDKKNELNTQKLSKKVDAEVKEKRLQKFYDTVKPKVESNPARIISFTQAEYNRRGVLINQESKFDEPKSLFNNYGYTDKQINSDARLRIEQRLRQAGLINTEYARGLISTFKTSTLQAKRDLNPNSCWQGFSMKEN